MSKHEEALQVHEVGELIVDEIAVNQAYDDIATRISADLRDKNPLLLAVMNGGLIPMGQLLPRIDFALRVDYLHATRYRDKTRGGEIDWIKYPQNDLAGEHLLIVDDIHDEGYTLQAIVEYCETQKPASIRTAVLAEKIHDRGVDMRPDYVGLQLPDRYVYGCGLDYKGFWRNLPAIYAVKEEN